MKLFPQGGRHSRLADAVIRTVTRFGVSLRKLLAWKWAAPALLVMGALGLEGRLYIAANTTGSTDILIWGQFAQDIRAHGVEWMYQQVPCFNHPPLMGWWSLAALKLSGAFNNNFAFVFKLLPIAGEVATGVLLFLVWRKRRNVAIGALAFALFACNPDSILVSAYHGNTDALCAMFVLLACWLLEEKDSPFGAGLALGAAFNVKLIPVLLLPVFLARTKSMSGLLKGMLGVALGVIPFIPMLLTCWPEFTKNAISYNSTFDNWGLAFLIRQGETSGPLQGLAASVHPSFLASGRYLVLTAAVAVCALARMTKKGDAYQLASIVFALFLALTPGFGVRYTVYLVPVLFAAHLRWAATWAWASGMFVLAVYYSYWTHTFPPVSLFDGSFPIGPALLGLLPWSLLLVFVARSVRDMLRVSVSSSPP